MERVGWPVLCPDQIGRLAQRVGRPPAFRDSRLGGWAGRSGGRVGGPPRPGQPAWRVGRPVLAGGFPGDPSASGNSRPRAGGQPAPAPGTASLRGGGVCRPSRGRREGPPRSMGRPGRRQPGHPWGAPDPARSQQVPRFAGAENHSVVPRRLAAGPSANGPPGRRAARPARGAWVTIASPIAAPVAGLVATRAAPGAVPPGQTAQQVAAGGLRRKRQTETRSRKRGPPPPASVAEPDPAAIHRRGSPAAGRRGRSARASRHQICRFGHETRPAASTTPRRAATSSGAAVPALQPGHRAGAGARPNLGRVQVRLGRPAVQDPVWRARAQPRRGPRSVLPTRPPDHPPGRHR